MVENNNVWTLEGIPPSVNHAYTNRIMKKRIIRFPNKKFKDFKEKVGERLAGIKPTNKPVLLECTFYLPDRRRRDLDNLLKVLLDGLQSVLFEDDSQVVEIRARKLFDPEYKDKTIISYQEVVV